MNQFTGQLQPGGGYVTLVHLVFPTKQPPNGDDWRIACMPNMTEFYQTASHPNYQHTPDPRAVTCPQCKQTAVFAARGALVGMVVGRTG
jgi:hypothetical protein